MRSIILLFLLLFFCNLSAQEKSDFQIWHISSLRVNVHDEWQIYFGQRYNVSWNTGNTEFNYLEAGFSYSIKEWLDVGLSYKQAYYNKKDSSYYVENRPQLMALISTDYSDFSFSFRNRLDYRRFVIKETYFYVNNKSSVRYTKYPIQPVISEEIFYNIEKPKIEMLRLTAGLFYAIDFFRVELYYGHLSKYSNDAWKNSHGFGNTLSFIF